MSFDLKRFGQKLRLLMDERMLDERALAGLAGIAADRAVALSAGLVGPTGDEVLILADIFQCDFRFFISDDVTTARHQTKELYRMFGGEFSRDDRKAIQEFLFLCESEAYLQGLLRPNRRTVTPIVKLKGGHYKSHGKQVADSARLALGHPPNGTPRDVFGDIRRLGFHVFRRKLGNSAVSGLTIRHPIIGPCILVNYSEDPYRQRFTALHEAAHALIDINDDVIVSFQSPPDDAKFLEYRANAFAGRFLLPPALLRSLPSTASWGDSEVAIWAEKLSVNAMVLMIQLKEEKLATQPDVQRLGRVRMSTGAKTDPELARRLPAYLRGRREKLLERGLSGSYVELVLEALDSGYVSEGRAAEFLLTSGSGVSEYRLMFRGSQ